MGTVRKRSWSTRWDDRLGRRPLTPAPTTGWLIAELMQMTGIPIRRLRSYVSSGLLTPIEHRGTATRYSRRELLRLIAIMRARKETKHTLAEVKQRLDAYGDDKLEAWLREGPVPPAAAVALGFPARAEPSPTSSDSRERWSARSEAWQRIQLLPGHELQLGPNPSPAALRAVEKICAEYLS